MLCPALRSALVCAGLAGAAGLVWALPPGGSMQSKVGGLVCPPFLINNAAATPANVTCGSGSDFSAVRIDNDDPDAGSMPVFICGTNSGYDGGVVGGTIIDQATANASCPRVCLAGGTCPLGPTYTVDVKQRGPGAFPNVKCWSLSGTADAGVRVKVTCVR